MLTASDGGKTDVDTFWIKIWDKSNDEIIYDNKMGSDDAGYDGTELGGMHAVFWVGSCCQVVDRGLGVFC